MQLIKIIIKFKSIDELRGRQIIKCFIKITTIIKLKENYYYYFINFLSSTFGETIHTIYYYFFVDKVRVETGISCLILLFRVYYFNVHIYV